MTKAAAVKQNAARNLKLAIAKSIRKQGFDFRGGRIHHDQEQDKTAVRNLHQIAVAHKRSEEKRYLHQYENDLLQHIADGSEVSVPDIEPELVLVEQKTDEALLFRYIQLHWSIPISNGYGRRLRFLVRDRSNGKVIGIIGLSDPVYSLRARDQWVGWDEETKKKNLYHVMDAYVLGAVPPYSQLLCGKLIATLAISSEVQAAFKARYKDQPSRSAKIVRPPYLALVTTTSALGRSSIYNRLAYDGRILWHALGYTQGSGTFHFANGLYKRMKEFAEIYCLPTARSEAWGEGFRNRREVIGKCLTEIGYRDSLRYHNVMREIYAAPCGDNALRFLRGEIRRPKLSTESSEELFELFRKRWLLPRAERQTDYQTFKRETYALWPR